MGPLNAALLCSAIFILAAADQQAPRQKSQRRECPAVCPTDRMRPVCGTDEQTYPSRCQLLQARCQGHPVQIEHKGYCKGEKKRCWTDRNYAQRIRRPPEVSLFVPACLEDGSYAPVQCHRQTGYCWCVTASGKPIPSSSVRYKQPDCAKRRKSSTRRRSSRGRKQRKSCSREDRSTFNNNLVKIFRTEFNRLPLRAALDLGDADELKKRVIDWKFTDMDRDQDEHLHKSEYRELRKLVKKIVRPRRCAKTFTRICDMDHDERISRSEWTVCLGVDINISYHLFLWLNSDERQEEATHNDNHPDSVLQGSIPTFDHSTEFTEDPVGRKDTIEVMILANDCQSDRQTALDDQKHGSSNFYVPECTPDGRYQKVQCYKSTGYCWCVYEDSGKPIPGTSVKDDDPKCESIPAPYRQMKGCPEHKKQAFLKELKEFLMKKMASSTKNNTESSTSTDPKWQVTPEEHMATWNFLMLDKNKNKVLERKEWKTFRALVASNRQMKRCGKKLPRYCDINNDRKISVTEWLNCLNSQRSNKSESAETSATNPSPGPGLSKRRGQKNPLESFLKSDD